MVAGPSLLPAANAIAQVAPLNLEYPTPNNRIRGRYIVSIRPGPSNRANLAMVGLSDVRIMGHPGGSKTSLTGKVSSRFLEIVEHFGKCD